MAYPWTVGMSISHLTVLSHYQKHLGQPEVEKNPVFIPGLICDSLPQRGSVDGDFYHYE